MQALGVKSTVPSLSSRFWQNGTRCGRKKNTIKSRCLYDMTMLFNGIRPDDLEPAHKQQLETVRAKLKINHLKVEAHMEAVRDIAEMIKETIAAWEADGTYSADQFRVVELS